MTALNSEETLIQLAERFDFHPNQITQWRSQLPERAAELFAGGSLRAQEGPSLKELHAKIGHLALENDFWSGDELHLELPLAGARMLNQEGHRVGRKHVRTLMRRTAIEAIYRKKNTAGPIRSMRCSHTCRAVL